MTDFDMGFWVGGFVTFILICILDFIMSVRGTASGSRSMYQEEMRKLALEWSKLNNDRVQFEIDKIESKRHEENVIRCLRELK